MSSALTRTRCRDCIRRHVAVGAVVGEDPGVGDAEALEVVGDQRRRRLLQRQVDVDRVEAGAVEEVVALGPDRLLQVGARSPHRDQGQVVVLVDLDLQLGPALQLGFGPRLRQGSAQLAQS